MKGEIIKKINISEKFNLFKDYWNPRIIGELNNQHVKLAKLKGDFIWHKHDKEDEMFMVIKGKLKIEFRNKSVILNEGELIIVPRGIEHKPVAEEEVQVLLFEPVTTLNTGDIKNERTILNSESI